METPSLRGIGAAAFLFSAGAALHAISDRALSNHREPRSENIGAWAFLPVSFIERSSRILRAQRAPWNPNSLCFSTTRAGMPMLRCPLPRLP